MSCAAQEVSAAPTGLHLDLDPHAVVQEEPAGTLFTVSRALAFSRVSELLSCRNHPWAFLHGKGQNTVEMPIIERKVQVASCCTGVHVLA